MEWVEMTAKSVDEATSRVLEALGVAEDEAEVEVVEEPRAGLFGLSRGQARVRGRVRPTEVRPKVERRRGRKSRAATAPATTPAATPAGEAVTDAATERPAAPAATGKGRRGRSARSTEDATSAGDAGRASDDQRDDSNEERTTMNPTTNDDATTEDRPPVTPEEVGQAAVSFLEGLVDAFGLDGEVSLMIEGTELDVEVDGGELGLLIGPGGRTLNAVQDLTRVAAQRRLGDHETRLRVDVAGYRERRREALERFARTVADQVKSSGRPRSLEPMMSSDRKVIHDVLVGIEGVTSRSEGDDPDRRIIVLPE